MNSVLNATLAVGNMNSVLNATLAVVNMNSVLNATLAVGNMSSVLNALLAVGNMSSVLNATLAVDNDHSQTVFSIDPSIALVILFINHAIGGVISGFGIIFNIINVLVFWKMGLNETVNVTLLELSVLDLLSLLTALWVSVCWSPLLYYADLDFVPEDVEIYTGSLPHGIFSRVTGWITALVAFERCMCVVLPFDVGTVITPARSICFTVASSMFVIAAQLPSYFPISLQWLHDPSRNRTLLKKVSGADSSVAEALVYNVGLVSPFGFIAVIVVCTVVTSVQLQRVSRWRQGSSSGISERAYGPTAKEKKIVKMVVLVSAVFIASYLPMNVFHVSYFALASDPPQVGKNWAAISVALSFVKILESINATVTIFLYYSMCSKYRLVFTALARKVTKQ
ncbi:hypothetical protein Btru_032778 [Bulinus truncatus]|nr:hypothetical protein Btru_032778 [Bulinus truncatus]